MSIAELIIEVFNGVIIDEYDILHYKVDNKKYDITYNEERREWGWDCPAFKWHKKSKAQGCKHIKAAKKKRFDWLTSS